MSGADALVYCSACFVIGLHCRPVVDWMGERLAEWIVDGMLKPKKSQPPSQAAKPSNLPSIKE